MNLVQEYNETLSGILSNEKVTQENAARPTDIIQKQAKADIENKTAQMSLDKLVTGQKSEDAFKTVLGDYMKAHPEAMTDENIAPHMDKIARLAAAVNPAQAEKMWELARKIESDKDIADNRRIQRIKDVNQAKSQLWRQMEPDSDEIPPAVVMAAQAGNIYTKPELDLMQTEWKKLTPTMRKGVMAKNADALEGAAEKAARAAEVKADAAAAAVIQRAETEANRLLQAQNRLDAQKADGVAREREKEERAEKADDRKALANIPRIRREEEDLKRRMAKDLGRQGLVMAVEQAKTGGMFSGVRGETSIKADVTAAQAKLTAYDKDNGYADELKTVRLDYQSNNASLSDSMKVKLRLNPDGTPMGSALPKFLSEAEAQAYVDKAGKTMRVTVDGVDGKMTPSVKKEVPKETPKVAAKAVPKPETGPSKDSLKIKPGYERVRDDSSGSFPAPWIYKRLNPRQPGYYSGL